MVQEGTNFIPRHDCAEAIVRINRIARELESITAKSNCDTRDVALKAVEIRDAAALVRDWALMEMSEI